MTASEEELMVAGNNKAVPHIPWDLRMALRLPEGWTGGGAGEVVAMLDSAFFEYWQKRVGEKAEDEGEQEGNDMPSTLSDKELQRLQFIRFLLGTGKLKP